MREILFRGKRVDNGEWVEGYLSFVYIDVPEKARQREYRKKRKGETDYTS